MSKAKKQKNANKHRALSAQQTIPYIAMHPDGICQLPGGLYTKTLEYEDINYAVRPRRISPPFSAGGARA